MALRPLLLLVLLLPGLLLPADTRVRVCVCEAASAKADVDPCADMPCCAPHDAEEGAAAGWSSAAQCRGCLVIAAPRSTEPKALLSVEIDGLVSQPIELRSPLCALLAAFNPCPRRIAAPGFGPPGIRVACPLRI